jgi:hypothetical protein
VPALREHEAEEGLFGVRLLGDGEREFLRADAGVRDGAEGPWRGLRLLPLGAGLRFGRNRVF